MRWPGPCLFPCYRDHRNERTDHLLSAYDERSDGVMSALRLTTNESNTWDLS